jgi:hypothetical protein
MSSSRSSATTPAAIASTTRWRSAEEGSAQPFSSSHAIASATCVSE